MGYSYNDNTPAAWLQRVHDFRWQFAKDQEYPDYSLAGYYHPNLVMEDIWWEMHRLYVKAGEITP